jgi:hypothetical protein
MNNSGKFSLSRWLRSRTGWVLILLFAIAAFFLITEHRAHLFGFLPYALLIASLLLLLYIRREQNRDNQHDSRHTEDKE